MIAPLCGDGQAMALESAVLLADAVKSLPRPVGEGDIAALSQEWDRTWRKRFADRLRLGRFLQFALLRAAAGETAVRLISRVPRLGTALVRATRSPA